MTLRPGAPLPNAPLEKTAGVRLGGLILDILYPVQPLRIFTQGFSIMTRKHVETMLIIGLGGFVGANLRYVISVWAAAQFGQNFPWATLLVNFTGSLFLAVFVGWTANHLLLDPKLRMLVAVGFFGAYTTFSTYAVESVAMAQTGNWIGAFGNFLGMNLICLIGAAIGLAVGSKF